MRKIPFSPPDITDDEINEVVAALQADLAKAAEITGYTMTKMNKNEPVSLEVIMRVCKVFHCDIGEVLEVLED